MSNRLVRKAAMQEIVNQEDALKIILAYQAKLEAGVGVEFPSNFLEVLSKVERHLKESLDWTASIHEIGD